MYSFVSRANNYYLMLHAEIKKSSSAISNSVYTDISKYTHKYIFTYINADMCTRINIQIKF